MVVVLDRCKTQNRNTINTIHIIIWWTWGTWLIHNGTYRYIILYKHNSDVAELRNDVNMICCLRPRAHLLLAVDFRVNRTYKRVISYMIILLSHRF